MNSTPTISWRYPDLPELQAELGPKLTIRHIGPFHGRPIDPEFQADAAIERAFGMRPFLHRYGEIVRTQRMNCTVYELNDVVVAGNWGFLGYPERELSCNLLPKIGWNRERSDVFAEQLSLSALSRPATCAAPTVMLSFPGALTFGHWQVDIVSRLELVRVCDLPRPVKFAIPAPTPRWCLPFLAMFGACNADFVELRPETPIRFERLFIPTLPGSNGFMSPAFFGPLFARMRGLVRPFMGSIPIEDAEILPLHTTLSSRHDPRRLTNRDQVVDFARQEGVVVVDPLTLSIPEQISLFARARLVIGEDSSALHNVLWSPGSDLIVLHSPDRTNYYHQGIQRSNGGRLCLIKGEKDGDGKAFRIELERLRQALRIMRARVDG